jgi:hypothetical protein
MKKFIVIVLFLAALNRVNAQTEKGTYLLGGSAAFTNASGNSVFQLSPNVGYFVADNLAFGVNATLVSGSGNTATAIGPFGRYYFGGTENGKFFGQLGVNFGTASGSSSKFGAGLAAGYALFLNRSVALQFSAEYDKAGSNDGIFTLGAGFQIHLRK